MFENELRSAAGDVHLCHSERSPILSNRIVLSIDFYLCNSLFSYDEVYTKLLRKYSFGKTNFLISLISLSYSACLNHIDS